MTFQKIKFTRWLTACFVSFFLLSGCTGPEVTLGFPFANGSVWVYQGTITYKIGKQEQTMPPLTFKLLCHQITGKRNSPFELSMLEEGERRWSVLLDQTSNGIANPLTGELWLPIHLKIGKKWTITMEGEKTQLILGNQNSTTVPAGTFPTYLIDFRRPKEGRGSFFLDPNVGIVLLNWTSRTQGGRLSLHLELTSYPQQP